MSVVTSAVKLTLVHLRGQQDHNMMCRSDSHYIWKIYLIFLFFFNSNRQKVKHLTKLTTSGLTDRTTELFLPSCWTWLH